jgi:hypothetical protein
MIKQMGVSMSAQIMFTILSDPKNSPLIFSAKSNKSEERRGLVVGCCFAQEDESINSHKFNKYRLHKLKKSVNRTQSRNMLLQRTENILIHLRSIGIYNRCNNKLFTYMCL